MWAISVPCALPDRIMRMGQWATCRTDHAAHAKAHVRAGIADHPDGPWTVQGMVPRTTLTDHGPFGGPTKYVVHAKAHAGVLLQCLLGGFGSVFPQCGLMVFPGAVIVSR